MMAMAGIATGANIFVWQWFVGYLGTLWGLVLQMIRLIGSNAAWNKANDANEPAAVQQDSATTFEHFEQDMQLDAAMAAATAVLLAWHGDNWFLAQFENSSIAFQDVLLAEYEAEVEEKKREWSSQTQAKSSEDLQSDDKEDEADIYVEVQEDREDEIVK